ncbi:GNAT family N-acetyltransferase [Nocardioides sp. TF02-7]|uniref:GNAT family N-acetyltransferase n=1 Tax=Nocardioides sp. TF02-7 TaxID=2917724 RepID=UPI001F06653B|nr:GNAT family N-acetyltransferase [Nocardioides sp. TF02-7]UMG93115.1 GNAT family N-acetyltransferase [Nocardioides sp. TF02-7]
MLVTMTALHLATDRLVIRPWRLEEAERLLDILGRMEVMKWLGDGEVRLMQDVAEARDRIQRYAERSAVAPLGVWAVEVAATGQVAGTVLLLTLPHADAGEVEIGWHLHPDSWGHGYATEAAEAVLRHGFAHGLPEIHAVTHLGNAPSQNVCRKLGMRHQGVVHRWYDGPSEHYVITRDEHAVR